jgi:hypothetical protein
MTRAMPHRFLALAAVLAVVAVAQPAPPAPEGAAAVIGQPTGLTVQPAKVELTGSRDLAQLVVTGHYPGGAVRDLTPFVSITASNTGVVSVSAEGRVAPLANGQATLIVRAGGKSMEVAVTVRGLDKASPVSFRREVVAVFNVAGCNAGACHGTPAGKNGFRLSLRGYDPDGDFLELTHDAAGRRTRAGDPEHSLLLLKALGRVSHEGGPRFPASSVHARILHDWIVQGLPDDTSAAAVTRLEVLPGSRVLAAPARWQQLAVLAHFADGSVRDVTALTVFSSSDEAVADVTAGGLVEFKRTGEVAILARYLQTMQTVLLAYLEPRPGFVWADPPEHNYVDKHVFAKLKQMSLPPSEICSDTDFLRRVTMDVCGVLPTPDEVQAFLADKAKDKRVKLIDALLERPEFADQWTLRWADVLRLNRKLLGEGGVATYHQWLHGHVAKNTPFDKVVRELLTAQGNTFKDGPANYFRAARTPEDLAETTAQLFLGVRLQCTKCHNHPFEKWTQDDYYATAAFFAQVKQKQVGGKKPDPKVAEVISIDPQGEVQHPRSGATVAPRFLGGKAPTIAPGQDRRTVFADWLTAADNPFFARAVVNRLWFHLFGRGIVDAPDDFRDSNPPANEALLDALANDFAAQHFDVKHVLRVILNSRTYQLSSTSNAFNKDDTRYFSHCVPRLLTAEQMLDAICQVTEVPETIAGMPPGTRVMQVPDFVEVPQFLRSISRPARELACECERDPDPNLAVALEIANGKAVARKVAADKNRLTRLLAAKRTDDEIAMELFLAALSRPPSEDELARLHKHLARGPDRRRAWEDVVWSLVNLREFLYRH